MSCVVLSLVLVGAQWVARLNPKNDPPPPWAAIPVSFAWVYGRRWLQRRFSPTVTLFDRKVFRSNGVGHETWQLQDLHGAALNLVSLGRVLVLRRKDGYESIIGVPEEIDAASIKAYFTARGVTWVEP